MGGDAVIPEQGEAPSSAARLRRAQAVALSFRQLGTSSDDQTAVGGEALIRDPVAG